mmetsp:Transcript_40691/g.122552  ORF Transcript_40691/g.122552 Transcript_40691/m.122552 type:complete len:317 (-) Transcript_40691:1609-2559(-)
MPRNQGRPFDEVWMTSGARYNSNNSSKPTTMQPSFRPAPSSSRPLKNATPKRLSTTSLRLPSLMSATEAALERASEEGTSVSSGRSEQSYLVVHRRTCPALPTTSWSRTRNAAWKSCLFLTVSLIQSRRRSGFNSNCPFRANRLMPRKKSKTESPRTSRFSYPQGYRVVASRRFFVRCSEGGGAGRPPSPRERRSSPSSRSPFSTATARGGNAPLAFASSLSMRFASLTTTHSRSKAAMKSGARWQRYSTSRGMGRYRVSSGTRYSLLATAILMLLTLPSDFFARKPTFAALLGEAIKSWSAGFSISEARSSARSG